jgi:hypothetical protein
MGTITAGLILPITLPVAVHQLTRDNPEDLYLDEQDEKQTDLLAYISPTQQHPLWESTLEPIYGRFHQNFDIQNRLRTPYLGYSVLLLALVGASVAAPRSRAWTIMAVILILFALGPILRVNGQLLPQIPMPYRLVENNPLMRLLRQTDRINVLLGLPVGILAGFGMAAVRRWLKRPSLYLLLAGVFALLILGEYASFPFPQSSADVPDWLIARRDDPDDYAIVHLPNHLFGHNKYYMYYQTVHGKPLANGKVARVPREALAYWESVPLLDGLQDVEAIQINRADVSRQLQLLHDAGFRYLIIHKNLSEGRQVVIWRDWFTIEPLYEDEDLLVYTTAPQAGADFDFRQMLTASIGLIRSEINLDTAVPGGALKTTLRLGSTAPPGQALQACLQLTEGEGVVYQACDLITPNWSTAVWPENAVARTGRNIWIDEAIPPGEYTLRLQLADGKGNLEGETAALGPVRVDPYAPTATADVTWGDVISLPDYRLEQGDDALQLTLYWQAERSMAEQYKFFVHLLDPDNGEIAAQVDAAPRDWSYPTFAWEPGERVHDNVTLSLADVPSGRYHLVVGWYNEETGERLLTNSSGGPQTNETTARLTTVTVP